MTKVGPLTVKLIPGISSADLGLTEDERLERLLHSAQKGLGRAVNLATETITVPESEALGCIQSAIDSASIPDFENLDESDLDRIRADFPSLSDSEISENIDNIRRIYLDEVSALTLNVLSDSLEGGTSGVRDISLDSDLTLHINDAELTIFELSIMALYPFSALTLNATREKAFELVSSYLHCEPDLTNDKSDAFRHSIWTQTLAKMGFGLRSEKIAWARAFSFYHELGSKWDSTGRYSSRMDWHNNEVGIDYYASHSKRRYTTLLFLKWESGVDEPSYGEICRAMKPKALGAVFIDNSITYEDPKSVFEANPDDLVYIDPDNKEY